MRETTFFPRQAKKIYGWQYTKTMKPIKVKDRAYQGSVDVVSFKDKYSFWKFRLVSCCIFNPYKDSFTAVNSEINTIYEENAGAFASDE